MLAVAVFEALHRGSQLAGHIQCARADRLAWLGVYPLDLAQPLTREFLRNQGVRIFPASGRAYHLRTFEVERTLLDENRSLSEADLLNKRSALAFDDDELLRRIQEFGATVESLEPPFKSNYPI